MEFYESKAVNADTCHFSSGACFERKSPIHTFLRFLSLKIIDTKVICQIKHSKWKWACPFYYITPTSASSPWWCRPRCVGKSASAGINSPFKLNRACIPYNKRVEGEKDYFYYLTLHYCLKYHFLQQLLEGDSSKTPQVRPQFLQKIYSPLSFFLSFHTCFTPDYSC